jgi:excisionase family DNA binding protein
MAERKLHTIRQTAEILNMSERTIWAWRGLRRISVIQIGRSVRVPQAEIDRLLTEGTIPARSEAR